MYLFAIIIKFDGRNNDLKSNYGNISHNNNDNNIDE